MSASTTADQSVDSREYEAVVEYLAALICEGWRKADMVGSLLDRIRGKQSSAGSTDCELPASDQLRPGSWDALLLEFGSLLRIAQWEQAGLTAHLPVELPPASESLLRMRKSLNDGVVPKDAGITRRQTDAWLSHFAWWAPEEIGVDVVQCGTPHFDEGELDRLAAILWEVRHSQNHEATTEEAER